MLGGLASLARYSRHKAEMLTLVHPDKLVAQARQSSHSLVIIRNVPRALKAHPHDRNHVMEVERAAFAIHLLATFHQLRQSLALIAVRSLVRRKERVSAPSYVILLIVRCESGQEIDNRRAGSFMGFRRHLPSCSGLRLAGDPLDAVPGAGRQREVRHLRLIATARPRGRVIRGYGDFTTGPRWSPWTSRTVCRL